MSKRSDSIDTSVFPNLESFKKMVRLLNLARRNFLEKDFKCQSFSHHAVYYLLEESWD